jgi:hypothetical protein
METLNAGANATTIAERFLGVAVNILNGRDAREGTMRSDLATLVVQAKSENLMKKIQTIVLTPRIQSVERLNERIKGIRDRLNPNGQSNGIDTESKIIQSDSSQIDIAVATKGKKTLPECRSMAQKKD